MDECAFCGSTAIRAIRGAAAVYYCDYCGCHSCVEDEDIPKKAQKTRLRNNPFADE